MAGLPSVSAITHGKQAISAGFCTLFAECHDTRQTGGVALIFVTALPSVGFHTRQRLTATWPPGAERRL